MEKYRINVQYGDNRYSPLSLLYVLNFFSSNTINVDVREENFKTPVLAIAKSRKDEERAYLDIGNLLFVKETVDGTQNCFFEENWVSTITFSFDKAEGECPLDYMDKISFKNIEIDLNFMEEVLSYVGNIATKNPAVFDFYKSNLSNLSSSRYSFTRVANDEKNKIFLENLIRLTTTNLLEIEKLITSNNVDILVNFLNTKNATLDKGKKLAKVISIPKFALDYMKSNGLLGAQESVRGIASDFDGNILNIIFDLFDAYASYEKMTKNKWDSFESKKINFIDNCYYLLKEGYKITPLLNYLLRQSMFYNDKNGFFRFPYEQAKALVDYINLCKENNFTIEKFPQDLERAHDITLMNSKELTNESKKEAFNKAIENNYSMDDLEIDDFTFSVPKSIEDLVLEGNKLHHCIGSYTDNIIENTSHIYFMRFSKTPNESYVTIELSPKTHDLIEFKGNYNKEPTEPEVIKAVNKFVKEVKKMAKAKPIVEEETEED